MKAEHANCFIITFIKVLGTFFQVDAKTGKAFIRKNNNIENEILIMPGVTGDITGHVIFSLSKNSATYLISKIMSEQIFDKLEYVLSGMGEMGNMVLGNAAVLLENNKVKIDITPPQIILGEQISLSSKIQNIVIPFEVNKDKINMDISLKYITE